MSAVLSEQPEPLTSVEDAIASATAPRRPTSPRIAVVSASRPPTADRGSRRPPRGPVASPPLRGRLVPGQAPGAVPVAAGPVHRTPLGVRERIAVMRASDRSLVLECADEDRGDVPAAEPTVVIRTLGLAAVEVILGRRPAAQLARWLTPGVLQALRTRADLHRRATEGTSGAGARPPVVRRTRVCPVEPHVVEGAVVIDDGCRVRAVAVRLETHRGIWRATALDVG